MRRPQAIVAYHAGNVRWSAGSEGVLSGGLHGALAFDAGGFLRSPGNGARGEARGGACVVVRGTDEHGFESGELDGRFWFFEMAKRQRRVIDGSKPWQRAYEERCGRIVAESSATL